MNYFFFSYYFDISRDYKKIIRIIYYLLRQQKFSVEGAKQYLKDNKKKAELQVQLVETLTKFRSFLLELRANLGA